MPYTIQFTNDITFTCSNTIDIPSVSWIKEKYYITEKDYKDLEIFLFPKSNKDNTPVLFHEKKEIVNEINRFYEPNLYKIIDLSEKYNYYPNYIKAKIYSSIILSKYNPSSYLINIINSSKFNDKFNNNNIPFEEIEFNFSFNYNDYTSDIYNKIINQVVNCINKQNITLEKLLKFISHINIKKNRNIDMFLRLNEKYNIIEKILSFDNISTKDIKKINLFITNINKDEFYILLLNSKYAQTKEIMNEAIENKNIKIITEIYKNMTQINKDNYKSKIIRIIPYVINDINKDILKILDIDITLYSHLTDNADYYTDLPLMNRIMYSKCDFEIILILINKEKKNIREFITKYIYYILCDTKDFKTPDFDYKINTLLGILKKL
jgi:hypothetical protein